MELSIHNVIDSVAQKITAELQEIKAEFGKAIEHNFSILEELKNENSALKTKCSELENRVTQLENSVTAHSVSLNNQERLSRRNNLRVVGYNYRDDENCLDIATAVMEKVGVSNPKIERAHRDRRGVSSEGHSGHILIKLTFYQDKVMVMKNCRHSLANDEFFITDDLTASDLQEKRKFAKDVSELYSRGIKLRFYGGNWRRSGKPYDFSSV